LRLILGAGFVLGGIALAVMRLKPRRGV